MNTSPASLKRELLRDRALLFQEARAFFAARNVLEVDTPLLFPAAPIDLHIEVMPVQVTSDQTGYLHTSPEYGMKRLLSEGSGDIYQMSHVFRKGEISPLHNPVFTMVEWYRQHLAFEEMIEETLDFIRLFLGPLPATRLTYRQAFQSHPQCDPATATTSTLLSLANSHGLDLPEDAHTWDKDTLLQLLLGFLIEPHLGKEELTVLAYFPPTQAALSKTLTLDTETVACRFEIYRHGIELANGYQELTDATEQRRRLIASNAARKAAGKPELPLDEHFLAALERGLPECCGVAVGFDRLMLLRQGKTSLKEVLPFVWESPHIQP